MKILHISKYYYPFVGGVEQVARDCATALCEGNEQRVVCFNHEKGDAEDEVDGIRIVRAGCFAKVASQSLSFHYKKILKRQLREFAPDAVIFHFPNPFAAHYLLPLLKKYPCRLIVWYHLDITKQKLLGKLFAPQSRRLLKRAQAVVATSPNYIDGSKFLSAVRDKCRVIPCCANAQRIRAGEAEMREAEKIRQAYAGKTILFTVGRHVPYKGLDKLVEASRYLDDGYAVLIGGQGPMTDSLKKAAEGDKKLVFLGRISDEMLKSYLLACDIYCFPSVTKNEAFGIALAEAMAFARPAVTFTIEGSGVNYVSLNGVTGIETENGNARAYAEAIETLAADRHLRERYGAAARARVEELFSEETFAHNVKALLAEISR